MWVLREDLAESFEFFLGQTLGQTLETRYKEGFQDGKKLIIRDIFSIKFGLALLDVKKHIFQYIKNYVFFLWQNLLTDANEESGEKYALNYE